MTRSSSRLLFLLTNPSSSSSLFVRHQRPVITLLRLPRRHSFTTRQIPTRFSANFSSTAFNHFAFQEDNKHVSDNGYHVQQQLHPWPEWSHLVKNLAVAGYSNRNTYIQADEFIVNHNLSNDFVAAAASCLVFARDRSQILRLLSRKDIEVMINEGCPFLFKSAHETERRMRSFLQAEGSNEATSVDLMKYILSYASNPKRKIKEATELTIRSMLQKIGNLINEGRASEQFEQMPRNLGPNITMKKGDWICTKCNFMNFARNTKCLECEEPRPQTQMTDGEWDCPRCNFLNYRRNTVCLKCDCRRPDAAPLHGNISGYVPRRHIHDTDKEEKTERWFKKVKELHGLTDSKNDTSHDFPRITPIRKEENRLSDNKSKGQPFPPYQGSTSGFVPFTSDYFAKKDNQQQPSSTDSAIKPTNETSYGSPNTATFNQNLVQETSNQSRINEPKPETSNVGQRTPENMNGKSGWTGKSLEGSAVTETDPLDMSEEAKAERWFKRVAQIKDISELSQIPDEDFPSIMPMRKGVNRFVVSKRKTPLERRLTSPQYRKNLRIMSSDPMKKEDD